MAPWEASLACKVARSNASRLRLGGMPTLHNGVRESPHDVDGTKGDVFIAVRERRLVYEVSSQTQAVQGTALVSSP